MSEGEMVGMVSANAILRKHHYLGPSKRGFAYADDSGVLVFANPNSRRLPQSHWLELVRWCILKGQGSEQWKAVVDWLSNKHPEITTVVSYSDPSAGHTGALYRACNWLWAPTWHRLRPPPSGNGSWKEGKNQAVKDRWIYPIKADAARASLLEVNDSGVRAKMPWASYREPRIRRGRFDMQTGGGDYKRWIKEQKTGKD